MSETVLEVRDLKTYFYTYAGVVKALDGVNLTVKREETLGLVGETGCGKSVTSLSIMRLVPDPPGRIVNGEILFKGENLLKMSDQEIRSIRGNKIAMIFQDPMTYINPVMTIGDQVAEVILLHKNLAEEKIRLTIEDLREQLKDSTNQQIRYQISQLESQMDHPPKLSKKDTKKLALRKAIDLLRLVRMPYPEKVVSQYPHELSGGMRQRAIIAMALACNPLLLIADEATTALDVTIQAQILALLNDLKHTLHTSIMIITHDLGIVAEMCDRVAVMYAGVVAEYSDTKKLFRNPLHPYTKGLLRTIPSLTREQNRLETIEGMVPNLIYPPEGCRFHPRCKDAMDICKKERPQMVTVEPDHQVACHLYTPGDPKENRT
jgi:oligopeptide/dipeptide ABC transporter ATP-binding protein